MNTRLNHHALFPPRHPPLHIPRRINHRLTRTPYRPTIHLPNPQCHRHPAMELRPESQPGAIHLQPRRRLGWLCPRDVLPPLGRRTRQRH